jgi:UDP-glucose 6-dehydrogenase
MKKTKNNLIVGYGEVGHALYDAFKKKPLLYDLKEGLFKIENSKNKLIDIASDIQFMHVCYKYTPDFIKNTLEYISAFRPYAVIVHSTVPVGITQQLNNKATKKYNRVFCFHSPVEGRHQYLSKAIQTFVKFLGVDRDLKRDSYIVKKTKEHLEKDMNIKVQLVDSKESELGKLLSIYQYAGHLLIADDCEKICKKFKVDYNFILNYNQQYNKGYEKIEPKKFSRPVLVADLRGGFGGHCIVPDIEIMVDQNVNTDIIKRVLKIGQKKL